MNKKLIYSFICLFCFVSIALGYGYVPDYSTMKNLRCDFEETIYNQDNSVVTQNDRFKIFKLDNANKKIFINKEPIDNIVYYEADKIEFNLQSMTDSFIEMSNTIIDMNALTYTSTSTITYDNTDYGVKYTKSAGSCRFVN